jgi:hypothetical protein
MAEELNKAISDLVNQRVEEEFKKIERDAKQRVEAQMANLEMFERDSRERLQSRLQDIEERVTRDVRTKVFSIALTIVVLAAGAMLVGSFAATRDVNNSVIGLQDRVIAAQATIQKSQTELNTQKDQMAEATRQATAATKDLQDARVRLKDTTDQFEKVRKEYDALAKAVKAAQR